MVIDWVMVGLALAAGGMVAGGVYLALAGGERRPSAVSVESAAAIEAMERAVASQAGRLDAQSRRIDELEAAIDAQELAHRAAVGALREEVEEAYEGIKLLLEQLQVAKMTPVWAPRPRPQPRGAAGETLLRRIVEGFNREEIDNLAFGMGFVVDDLSGGLEARARQLVDMARRTRKLGALERRVDELRPRVR